MPGKFSSPRFVSFAAILLTGFLSLCAAAAPKPIPAPTPAGSTAAVACSAGNTVTANVASLDQPFMLNRLGAAMPQGMVFALMSDVVNSTNGQSCSKAACTAGNVSLRADKRPRPMVLRVNQGQCLKINFTNLLASSPTGPLQVATRAASLHVSGLELVTSIADDGSNVGKNASSLSAPVPPGSMKTYSLYAAEEGTFLFYSMGSTFGAEGGQVT